MSSRAGQLVTVPTWGGTPKGRRTGQRPLPTVRFAIPGSPAADALGAAAVLGGSLALWTAVLMAIW